MSPAPRVIATRDLVQGDSIVVPVEFGTRVAEALVFDIERDAHGEATIHYRLSDGTVDYLFGEPDDTFEIWDELDDAVEPELREEYR